jgi:hypothetical protein
MSKIFGGQLVAAHENGTPSGLWWPYPLAYSLARPPSNYSDDSSRHAVARLSRFHRLAKPAQQQPEPTPATPFRSLSGFRRQSGPASSAAGQRR